MDQLEKWPGRPARQITREMRVPPQTDPTIRNVTISSFTIYHYYSPMFCPSCGSENTGLPYCKRCGANLSALTTQPQPLQVNLTKPVSIIAATLAVFTLGGFTALIGGARSLASVVQGSDPLMALIFFGMIVILIVDIFLARQLSKIISAALSSHELSRTPHQKVIPSPPLAQLQHQSAPGLQPGTPSVTENTTRFFEPASPYRGPSKTDELS